MMKIEKPLIPIRQDSLISELHPNTKTCPIGGVYQQDLHQTVLKPTAALPL